MPVAPHKKVLRVLILEDTPQRQKILQQLYRDHAWVLAHTAARAIRLLSAFEFDVISLDYNLAGQARGDAVAGAIGSGPSAGARVIIHSMNPAGRQRISAALPEALVLPVSRMVKTNATFKRLRAELSRGLGFDWSFILRRRRPDD